jgi:mono/diheme cytochrome c family protein
MALAQGSSVSLINNPVYQENCARCHGKSAEGHFMKGPSFTSGKAAAMSADDLHKLIANGKGHMPKFGDKLSSEQIGGLVEQISMLKR